MALCSRYETRRSRWLIASTSSSIMNRNWIVQRCLAAESHCGEDITKASVECLSFLSALAALSPTYFHGESHGGVPRLATCQSNVSRRSQRDAKRELSYDSYQLYQLFAPAVRKGH